MHFVLIHGTFVPEAKWTQEGGSALRRALEGSTEEGLAEFHRLRWTGKNRLRDRHLAALELGGVVRDLRSRDPKRPIVLIGHSHGGSVIAHFLKQREEGATRIDGCAFLSVPFYARRLDTQSFREGVLTAGVALALLYVGMLLLTAIAAIERLAGLGATWQLGNMGLTIVVLVAGMLLWAKFADASKRRLRRFERRMLLDHRRTETSTLPEGNYLFARVAGDEVTIGLQAGQAALYVLRRLVLVATNVLKTVSSGIIAIMPIDDGRERHPLHPARVIQYIKGIPGIVIALSTVFILSVIADQSARDLLRGRLSHVLNPFQFFFDSLSTGWVPISGWWEVPFFFAMFAMTLLIAFCLLLFIAMLGVVLVGMVLVGTLGFVSLFDALFTEFTVEPLPYGSHVLVQGNWGWRGKSRASFASSHGRVYEDPVIATAVSSWVRGMSQT